jgi:hypothetical protein
MDLKSIVKQRFMFISLAMGLKPVAKQHHDKSHLNNLKPIAILKRSPRIVTA